MDNSTVCELPKYPGVDGRGAVILQYLEDTQEIAACRDNDFSSPPVDMSYKSCYKLSGSSWHQNMPPLINFHDPFPKNTKSHYLNGKGWFVFSQDQNGVGLSTEIFNGSHWSNTPAQWRPKGGGNRGNAPPWTCQGGALPPPGYPE